MSSGARRRRESPTVGLARRATAAAVGAALGWCAERRWLDPARHRSPRPRSRGRGEPARSWALATGDGTRLHVEAHGPSDAPTIVLAHGWMMSLDFWDAQVADLAGRWRVVAYDQRGHGRSGQPPTGDWSIDALAGDLRAVLDAAVPDGERAVVAGHSMGAMALLALADADADAARARIAGSMLCSTGASDLLRHSAACGGNATLAAGARVAVPWLLGPHGAMGANDLSALVLRTLTLTPHTDPATIAAVRDTMVACPPRTRAGCARTIGRLDLSGAPARVPGPVLVLVGARDRLTPPRQSAALVAGRDDARLVVVPGIGHMVALEAPEVVAARLDAFAATVHGRPPGTRSARGAGEG